MIDVLKNKDGFVVAFIEWDILNYKGQFEKDGKFICVREAWIHEALRNSDALKELSLAIYTHEYSKQATHVYWEEFRVNGEKVTDSERKKTAKYKNRKPILKEKILNKILKKRILL